MRPGAILVSIVSLLLSLSVVVWLSRSSGKVGVDTPFQKVPIADLPDTPRPSSEEGSHPSADFAETEFNFGVMQLHDEGSHVFKVTNNGDAPLRLKSGKSTCQCTVGSVGTEEVPPGESTTIEMSWEIRNPYEVFEHSAIIHTNAPEHENGEIRLIVRGKVVPEYATVPLDTLDMGMIRETTSKPFYIYSRYVDDFDLLSVECSIKGITTEVVRLTDDEMERLNREMSEELPPEDLTQPIAPKLEIPKCGYQIMVTVDPTIPVGINEIPVTVHTDLPKSKEFSYQIRMRRPMPIQFFDRPGGNTRYTEAKSLISGAPFDAEKGTKMELLMLAAAFDKPLEVSVLSTDPKWLEVSVSEEALDSGVSRYRLTISVPPGIPPVDRTVDNPAKVLLKTNHPDVEELNLNVTFRSQ